MAETDVEMIARALEMDPALLPHAAELLADFEELGSDSALIVEVVASLGLPAGSRVVDLGCGKGANAVALASALGFPVVGIDLYGPFVEHSREAANAAGVSNLCTFREGNVVELAGKMEPADVAVFAALGDVIGPLDAAMGVLRRYVKPGGYIVVSDAFLKEGGGVAFPGFEEYVGLEETRRRLTAWGDTIAREALETESDEDDDDEEAGWIRRRAKQIAAAHPELETQLMRFADSQGAAYEYIERYLSGAVWAVRRPGG